MGRTSPLLLWLVWPHIVLTEKTNTVPSVHSPEHRAGLRHLRGKASHQTTTERGTRAWQHNIQIVESSYSGYKRMITAMAGSPPELLTSRTVFIPK